METKVATETQPTMLALALYKFGKPDTYNIATIPIPKITDQNDVLIKVEAASVNPIDVKMASGFAKMMFDVKFPYLMGYDVSGTVVSVGSSVTHVKLGDEVYSRVPERHRGTIGKHVSNSSSHSVHEFVNPKIRCPYPPPRTLKLPKDAMSIIDFLFQAQYCLSTCSAVAHKPSSLSHSEAAAVPLAALTAYQSALRADSQLPGGLKGKTVLIPAGMSGTGSIAVQLAKNVFGAERVITTLSTGKIGRAEELFGKGIKVVDYTKEDVVKMIGNGSVDFLFDTTSCALSLGPLVKKGGVIVSISMVPGGTATIERMIRHIDGVSDGGAEVTLSWWIAKIMDFLDWSLRKWASWNGRTYSYLMMEPSRKDLDKLTGWIKEGILTPIIGSEVKLEDIVGVRKGCQEVFTGKGGMGKFVITP
ncbi:hypothetical protein SBOR_4170 [Sclerotinia borealis F-4128]|uniref:Enoyl reductase (ER) domain-containing protein n=1 Tax=Sclerotinia borealis (strain F-4128) TaxID=1432307 RepID=W9CLA3_SCLBF|nr:hypothetical protein SBOR_4170 [Sclerotinia borealis F-4128]